jgi:hypothetical protein
VAGSPAPTLSAATEHRYHGEARFEVLDSGALHVWPRDERGHEQVVYGPAEWLWVQAVSGPSVAATPQRTTPSRFLTRAAAYRGEGAPASSMPALPVQRPPAD